MGSQPSCTPNRIMSRRASQKSGVAKPTNTKTVVTLSKCEYWRVAETTPIGTARTTMISISTTLRSSVIGSRSRDLRAAPGAPSGANERPKSRRTMRRQPVPVLHVQRLVEPVRLAQPLPDLAVRRSVVARRCCSSVGSPGARWITMNEMKVMPIRSGSARTSRRSA